MTKISHHHRQHHEMHIIMDIVLLILLAIAAFSFGFLLHKYKFCNQKKEDEQV